jgi:hypothetical protein
MHMLIKMVIAVAVGAVLITTAVAQSIKEVVSRSPLVAIENEPAATLIVDQPVPGPLARGAVVIPYRAENFRIVPVLGAAAVKVSPRVGHLHVNVDGLPWYWGDFSDSNTIVVNGLPAGPHKVRVELADPEHRILTSQTVTFTVPAAR